MKRLLVTFGNGSYGRLGHGWPAQSESFPKVVTELIGAAVKHVTCGGAHTVAVTGSGTLFSFGLNNHGQLGACEGFDEMPVPQECFLPALVDSASAGETHTLAVSSSGEVWACGNNEEGQLGLGSSLESRNPDMRLLRHLEGLRVVQVAAGYAHSLALTEEGEVYSWGLNSHGQLGHGSGCPAAPPTSQALPGPRPSPDKTPHGGAGHPDIGGALAFSLRGSGRGPVHLGPQWLLPAGT